MHDKIKNSIFICILMMVFLHGCGTTVQEKNTESIEKQGTNKTVETVTEMEDEDMENLSEDEKLIKEISEILKCDETTAKSILKTMNDYTDDIIVDIVEEEGKARVRLKVTDKAGNIYLAILGLTYTVEEIYRDDINGEKIYQVIL